jgi:hypothetical protein
MITEPNVVIDPGPQNIFFFENFSMILCYPNRSPASGLTFNIYQMLQVVMCMGNPFAIPIPVKTCTCMHRYGFCCGSALMYPQGLPVVYYLLYKNIQVKKRVDP